jgi:hypothetical protein
MRSENVESDAMEQAADVCSQAFDRLGPDDQRALMVRLLMLGTLNAGEIEFIEEVAEAAREAVLAFVREREPANALPC